MPLMITTAEVVLRVSGEVRTGLGQGAQFTRLGWARAQFIEHCGIDPYPGTLNVLMEDVDQQRCWSQIRATPALVVRAPSAQGCDAGLYPVSIVGYRGTRIPRGIAAAVVVPDVGGYPADQLEIIAAIDLRDHLHVVDGDSLELEYQPRHAIEAAIFDIDGTLMNSLDGYRLAASRATKPFGYEVTLEHVRRALNSNQPFWDFVIPDGEPRDDRRIAELRDETMRHWPNALAEAVSVLPGTADALERLRADGIRLAIYTGSGGESMPPLRAAGLLDLFEVIVTGNDVERRKPDPQGIVRCLDELGVEASRAAYIGDSCIDVDASWAAGVLSIAVLTGAGDSSSLAAAGAHRLSAHIGGVPELLTAHDRLPG